MGAGAPSSALLLIAFDGFEAPAAVLRQIKEGRVAGVSLYRPLNCRDPQQIRDLTASIQAAAAEGGQPPAIVALDQEGGQLLAVGEPATAFAGNLALAAARSADLARRVGRAIGLELAAMGVNVNWAPVVDLGLQAENPAIGTRSFGPDPGLVSELGAAFIGGQQAAGVAATAKHFPGHGDTTQDAHYGLPVVSHALDQLRDTELRPFQAAIAAGVKLVMAAHIALPSVEPDGAGDRPVMLSPTILRSLLRDELGFRGVVVSDALDMGAIDQDGVVRTAVASIRAGVDLLLAGPAHARRTEELAAILAGIDAEARGEAAGKVAEARARVGALRESLTGVEQPGIEVVGSAEHRALADQLAQAAITLVRDRDRLLPVRAGADTRALVVVPRPADLTPADTSSFVRIDLAKALEGRGLRASQLDVAIAPSRSEIASVLAAAHGVNVVIVGTINAFAHPGQVELVRALARAGVPLVAAALRMPRDADVLAEAGTYLCTYSIHPASIGALADVLVGRRSATGVVPDRQAVTA